MFIVLLIGCSKEIIVEKEVIINRTIYVNNTIYINDTVPCNITCPEPEDNNTYNRLELIRRLEYLEGQQDLYFNDSECAWELNQSNIELEECKNELCEFNSSWCD